MLEVAFSAKYVENGGKNLQKVTAIEAFFCTFLKIFEKHVNHRLNENGLVFFIDVEHGFIFSYRTTDHLTNAADGVGVAFLFQVLLWHIKYF